MAFLCLFFCFQVGVFYTLGTVNVLYMKENLQLKVPGPLASAVLEKIQPSR